MRLYVAGSGNFVTNMDLFVLSVDFATSVALANGCWDGLIERAESQKILRRNVTLS